MKKTGALFLLLISASGYALNGQKQAPAMPDLSNYVKQDELGNLRQQMNKTEETIRTLQNQVKKIETSRTTDNQTMITYVDKKAGDELKKVTDDVKAMEERINRQLERINTKLEAVEKMAIANQEHAKQLENLLKKETGYR